MHDPEVLVFDLKVPIPVRRWKLRTGQRWGIKRRLWLYTGAPHPKAGTPIDPWWMPRAWEVHAAGRLIGWWEVADVWHSEPGGRDSGTVCGRLPSGSGLTVPNVRWAWRHRAHLRVTVLPYRRVKRWLFDRCDGCGKRFFWKQDRFGYQSGDAVYHDACMSLRHVQGQLDDLTAYVQFDADETQRWRVEYRLKSMAATGGQKEE